MDPITQLLDPTPARVVPPRESGPLVSGHLPLEQLPLSSCSACISAAAFRTVAAASIMESDVTGPPQHQSSLLGQWQADLADDATGLEVEVGVTTMAGQTMRD